MGTATLVFLIIGALGIVIAAVAVLGGDLLDLGDGFVSTELLATFVGGFGFTAAIVNELTDDALGIAAVVFIATVAAIPLAFLASYLVKRMSDMRTDATPTRADLVGTRGVVVTPIPAGGFGEVRVRIGGQPVKLSARAERPVPLGTKVVVTSAVTDTSVIVQELPEQ